MNRELIELILLTIGTILTIFSLIYLAIQIRGNTRATKGNMYQNMVSSVAEFEFAIFQSPDVAILYNKSKTGEDTTEIEKTRINEIISTYINFYENFYYQYSKKLIDEELWDGWKQTMIIYIGNPGVKNWWEINKKLYFKGFRDMVDNEIKKIITIDDNEIIKNT